MCTEECVWCYLVQATGFFMYTRVHDGMLCTQEYKAHFIVEVMEAFSNCFGYSHYTLTSVHYYQMNGIKVCRNSRFSDYCYSPS